MQGRDIVTATDVIASWRENLEESENSRDFDREAYEGRAELYEDTPSFEQYRALTAYVSSMWPGNLEYASKEERAAAHAGTFGALFPEASAEDLQRVLDDHYQAMSKAYDRELSSTLGGVTL